MIPQSWVAVPFALYDYYAADSSLSRNGTAMGERPPILPAPLESAARIALEIIDLATRVFASARVTTPRTNTESSGEDTPDSLPRGR
jgi:hypothetical protein